MMTFKTVDTGWVRLSVADQNGALRWLESAIAGKHPRFACFCEASLLSNVSRSVTVAHALRSADAVFADGVAMFLLARLAGRRLPERIPGPRFLPAACEYGIPHGWRHFFYGGAPGVARRLADRLCERLPGLQIADTFSPPFRDLTPSEEAQVKARIENSGTHVLWVCLGSPKQELWAAEHVGKINVPVMLPVGAAFDFHAGARPWAPAWVRCIGMEWLFRTFTGGRRTFFRNVRCVTVVAGILLRAAARRLTG